MGKILVTGGAGYIGSHTVVELLNAGYEVIVVDNFSNSHPSALNRVRKITGKQFTHYNMDLTDAGGLEKIFYENEIEAVIHFAAFKAIGESIEKPLIYYNNNLVSTLNLLHSMQRHSIKKLVFSSSCTVYGNPDEVPIKEDAAVHAANPYGQTKLMTEQILRDSCKADANLYVSCLRYFNPVGAHESGLIGEDPNDIPNNLLPYISQVAVGKLSRLRVFGNDYDTIDGTGVRDYIHVTDLAKGHLVALKKIDKFTNWEAYNLGTGQGNSVLQVIRAFESVTGKTIAYDIVARRPGDIDKAYADVSKSAERLEWITSKTLIDACRDAWNWQSKNPNGYID